MFTCHLNCILILYASSFIFTLMKHVYEVLTIVVYVFVTICLIVFILILFMIFRNITDIRFPHWDDLLNGNIACWYVSLVKCPRINNDPGSNTIEWTSGSGQFSVGFFLKLRARASPKLTINTGTFRLIVVGLSSCQPKFVGTYCIWQWL